MNVQLKLASTESALAGKSTWAYSLLFAAASALSSELSGFEMSLADRGTPVYSMNTSEWKLALRSQEASSLILTNTNMFFGGSIRLLLVITAIGAFRRGDYARLCGNMCLSINERWRVYNTLKSHLVICRKTSSVSRIWLKFFVFFGGEWQYSDF